MEYLPRICDATLKRKLEAKDAILIEGAKWCGKTTTAAQIAKSSLYMQQPETREQNIRLAEIDPTILLAGDTPRLIDEWQLAPMLWDAVRFEADRRQEFGQFILTGSTIPPEKGQKRHSGTGRIGRMRMRTMSLFESGESTGSVSLSALFAGEELPLAQCESNIEQLAFLVSRGGWPRAIGQTDRIALQQAYDYLDAIVESDISEIDGIRRSAMRARHIMRSYSRFISSQGKVSQIVADLNQADTGASVETVRSYLDTLRSLFVIEELPAWNPNLRSKAAVRTTETRHFTDPSIAVAALGSGPQGLMADLNTFGLLFESMCVRDLRIYADALDGFVSHYRDSNGLECDAVVHLRDGRYGLIEVKLGGQTLIEEGAANLLKLRNTIDDSRMGAPSFLMVLTGTGNLAYPLKNGVYVVPIGTLGV